MTSLSAPSPKKLQHFLIVWVGQVLSSMGSGLSSFALGIWVYQQTGSVSQYAWFSVLAVLPYVLFSPLAGILVDRWSRRKIMILSDVGAALSTLAIALLIYFDHLQLWHLYLSVFWGTMFNAIQIPAYLTSIPLLVPKKDLERANGLLELGKASTQLLSPMIAGFLLGAIALQGILVVDLVTFGIGVTTLMLVRFPEISPSPLPTESGNEPSTRQQLLGGWYYLTLNPGLLGLIIYFTVNYFFVAMVMVLFTPLILSVTTPDVLGIILTLAGVGMLLGSIMVSLWRNVGDRIAVIFGFTLLGGLCILSGGLVVSIPLYALAAFLFFWSQPFISTANNVILQKKVPSRLQGRIFAFNQTLTSTAFPVAYLVAGFLVDQFFEPLMSHQGLLASSIGRIIGTGQGRGISLLFVLIGLMQMVFTAIFYQYPRLRLLEKEMPDMMAD